MIETRTVYECILTELPYKCDTVVATVSWDTIPATRGRCCRRRRSSCRRWRSPLPWAACRLRTWKRKEMKNQWKWRISISANGRLYRGNSTIALKRRYHNLVELSGNFEIPRSNSLNVTREPLQLARQVWSEVSRPNYPISWAISDPAKIDLSLTSRPVSRWGPYIDIVPLPYSRRAEEEWGGGGRGEDPSETWINIFHFNFPHRSIDGYTPMNNRQ